MIFANIFTSVADIPRPCSSGEVPGRLLQRLRAHERHRTHNGGVDHGQPLWRWVFYINLPLGVFSLFALPVVLHQGARRFGVKIDYLGAATITASVVSCSRSRGSAKGTTGTPPALSQDSSSPLSCSPLSSP